LTLEIAVTRDDEDVDKKEKARYVAFILSQLRDDLEDLVTGLESGALTERNGGRRREGPAPVGTQ
jgi:hypothetical protein